MRIRLGCSGLMHHAIWSAGELVLEDHDAEAERALMGMGGVQPRCMELLDAWQWAIRAAGDDRELIEGHSAWELTALEEDSVGLFSSMSLTRALGSARLRLGGQGVPTPAQYMRQRSRMRVLYALPDALRRILRIELLRHREAELWESERRRWFLEADSALRSLVVPAVRLSLDQAGRGLGSRLSVAAGASPPQTPGEVAAGEGRVEVRVPFSWLVDVEGRGLACVSGLFVTEVVSLDVEGRARVGGFDWVRDKGSTRAVRTEVDAVRTPSGWEAAF